MGWRSTSCLLIYGMKMRDCLACWSSQIKLYYGKRLLCHANCIRYRKSVFLNMKCSIFPSISLIVMQYNLVDESPTIPSTKNIGTKKKCVVKTQVGLLHSDNTGRICTQAGLDSSFSTHSLELHYLKAADRLQHSVMSRSFH